MKKILLITAICFTILPGIFAQTSLEGKVTDKNTGEPILFGDVILYKNDVIISGTTTDLDGNYFFSDIDPGTYDVEARYLGYTAERQTGVVVKAGRNNKVDFAIEEGGVVLDDIVIKAYKAPLIDFDNTTNGSTVTAEKIRSLPTKSVNAIAATTAGVTADRNGNLSVRGSRTNATVYYIDGIRTSGTIPQSEIDQLQVITGGIEAKYGDVTGGIISLTSKGPSKKFSGGVEAESSQYLDAFGYNLLSANLSGPILKRSNGESLLGFRFSGQFRNVEDPSPSAIGVYRLSEEKIRELEENPTMPLGGTVRPRAESLRNTDVGAPLDARPNETDRDVDLTFKIDARLSDNIDISLSGSYSDSKDQFTPSTGWSLLNWTHNPFSYTSRYRGNFRFKHRIGQQGAGQSPSEDGAAAKVSSVRNLSYTLQLGYEKSFFNTEDPNHLDNYFNYGFWGEQQRTWLPIESIVTDTTVNSNEQVDIFGNRWLHQGYLQQDGEYIPNYDINPALARYNSINGMYESELSNVWSTLYENVGRVYNSNRKTESDRYTVNLGAGFDFLPGGSEKGRHSIQFGVIYEQRINRRWALAPRNLWQVARLNANRHIIGVDTSQIIGMFEPVISQGTLPFAQFQTLIDVDDDQKFFRAVRELTGQSLNEYVNVDGLNPDDLRLDMFSASELNDAGLIDYYGYDYVGNKIGTDVTFNDFFTSEVDGRRTFIVAPDQPVYIAGFIQDKFSYKDIIFRIGLRVDYYDANTKVLKDPYSLYEIESASDFFAIHGGTKPEAVGDDYKVYVNGEGSTSVIGYRDGDNWFLPNGTSVSGGNVIFNGGLVYPYLKGSNTIAAEEYDIQKKGFNPDLSFEDYTPQINWMPRLAFSFPISDEAGFFAHYDVLVQRPPSNTIQTALDYYYFNSIGRLNPNGAPANNSNLKPTKTIDSEVGFQQKLTNSSALKISAYYKELRDLIQRRFYTNVPAPLNKYETYGNLDFGTVRGFSFTYDRRRTGNLELSATYTLQLANGSGSDANSSSGLNNRGPIRTLIPLSFDERHRITGIVDYRYDSGKRYTGPRINGVDIFANAGVNLLINAVSGRPYTRRKDVAERGGTGFVGAINGARLPWTLNVDLRADKSFRIVTNEEKGSSISMNVYVRVQNLFNTKNVTGVYSFTGDPEDDGYLVSEFGVSRINSIENTGQDVDAFIEAYQWRLAAPGNYVLPRRIYIGAIMDF